MRGSHPGSFETAHALAWHGASWPRPERQTDSAYDLVVVGGGISGLAAAYFYRQNAGPGARVLVLDNHDDFGGHAKRNEFTVRGRTLLGYGGSQSIDTPSRYSLVAKRLLVELGVHVERFYEYFDPNFMKRHGLTDGILFDRPVFDGSGLQPTAHGWSLDLAPEELVERIGRYPVSDATRAALVRLAQGEPLDERAVRAHLAAQTATPAEELLRAGFGMTEQGLALLRDRSKPLWGLGLDTLSVAESAVAGLLGDAVYGLAHRALTEQRAGAPPDERDEPYIFHFPDGNATIPRLLVRTLIPGAVPGSTMEDVVTARADYGALDRAENAVRVRLNSTAIRAENRNGRVDVTYVREGGVERVVADQCVLACYNRMIPYLCPELPAEQRRALEYPEKVPLVIVNVALDNWRALADSGMASFYAPGGFLNVMGLDFPVSLGRYDFTADPGEPAVLQGWHVPTDAEAGTPPRERLRRGRRRLYETPFETFEREIRRELDAAWGRAGLDAGRDIAAITVNRWPHGYAYEYMDLWDDPAWGRGAGPHVVGRQQLGRITIANSDAEQYAYVNGAIDAAYRAVRELTTG